MPKPPEDLPPDLPPAALVVEGDPIPGTCVVPIMDDFARLPADEQVRRTRAWLDGLHRDDGPFALGVSAVDLVHEARAEMGWDPEVSAEEFLAREA